jgi:hypothetical protein
MSTTSAPMSLPNNFDKDMPSLSRVTSIGHGNKNGTNGFGNTGGIGVTSTGSAPVGSEGLGLFRRLSVGLGVGRVRRSTPS